MDGGAAELGQGMNRQIHVDWDPVGYLSLTLPGLYTLVGFGSVSLFTTFNSTVSPYPMLHRSFLGLFLNSCQ